MIFSSIMFIYYFLPVVILAYLISPKRYKNLVLLISSLCFYAWGEPRYVFLMLAQITVVYVFGILIDKYRQTGLGRVYMTLSILVCLFVLGYFKYADFFIDNINRVTGIGLPFLKVALPIGISFYTFQMISYLIDVKREEAAVQKNIIKLATYITMFPQLIAGPIVRYSEIAKQLDHRSITVDKAALGIRRFAIGLGKKVIIANTLAELCEKLNSFPDNTVIGMWIYLVAVSLQVYFDFSGYSDMAIGLGHILGFDFPENFNYPFISKSITEFWRRWHMTLGRWFRDYLYIPLGGNRAGLKRQIFNILIVWLATGLWHGAAYNFVVWGLYFSLFLVIEKLFLLKKLEKSSVLSHIYLILFTGISFIIFNADNMQQAFNRIGALFGAGGISFSSQNALFYIRNYMVMVFAAILGATNLPVSIIKRLKEAKAGAGILAVLEPLFIAAVIIISTAFLVNGSYNPFLYFRF